MSVAHRKLALLGLLAAGLPLVAAGTLAAAGRSLEAVLGLGDAFALALAFAGALVAVLWPLVALAPEVRQGGLRARALELLVIAAALAPGLRLAALLSRSSEEATARALVGLGALLVAQGVALAGLARTRAPRSVVASAFAALALGAPLAARFAEDALGSPHGLARGSIPAALLALLDGQEEPWALAAALAVLGALAALPAARRPRAATLLLGLLVATPVLAGDLELEPLRTRFLLGPRVRTGELAPLVVHVRASANGFEGELGATSGGMTAWVPLRLGPGREADVTLPAVGGGAGMSFVARPAGGEPFALPANDFQVLERWMPLVALGTSVPRELGDALHPRGGALIDEAPDLLPLAGRGGGALDAVALGRGASAALADFATLGGALVVPDVATLERLAAGAGPRRDTALLARRSLGAGSLVAPLASPALAVLSSALSLHAHVRPELHALGVALADEWPEPAATARTAGRIALLAFVLLAVLAVVSLVPAREPRATASFVLVALALTALTPLLVLQHARAPVYLETAAVWELPSGGTVAASSEVLRFGSPRRAFAEVGLAESAPLVPVFAREWQASTSLTEAHYERPVDGLVATPVRLRVPLGPGAPATFARRSVLALDASVTVSRDSVTNGLPWKIVRPLLVLGREVIALDDLAPGETRSVRGEAEPFDSFLHRARARPGFGLDDRKRLTLLAAALPVRSTAGTIRLAGFLDVPPRRRATRGVLEEAPGDTLILVTRH